MSTAANTKLRLIEEENQTTQQKTDQVVGQIMAFVVVKDSLIQLISVM